MELKKDMAVAQQTVGVSSKATPVDEQKSGGSADEKDGSSLEAIEGRLFAMSVDELIDLALEFESSPMRYFSREVLQ